MTEQSPDDAISDLETALTHLDTAREALGGFLEDHLQDHARIEMAYCIFNTLCRANAQARAAWQVLWDARPLVAEKRDKPPLKTVEDGRVRP